MHEIRFATADGFELNGILFRHFAAEGATVLHGATGVPFTYYKAFAEWYSSEKSRHVLIYEYRDSGSLSNREIKASKATMSDWGIHDQNAALNYMIEQFPDLDIHTIGHSLGGFCVPFHKNADRITSHVGVNSGLAYWPRHPWYFLPQVILFWFIIGPLATLVLGYMPGILLGMKQNLPSGVYWQWRRWCTNERLHEIDWGTQVPIPDLNKFSGKLKIIGTQDDVIIPWERVKILDRFFPNAKSVERKLLKPNDYKLRSVGHISVFSPAKSAIWKDISG